MLEVVGSLLEAPVMIVLRQKKKKKRSKQY